MRIVGNVYSWDESLATGIDEIDEQHKSLIEKMNELADAVGENGDKKMAVEIIEFMEDYGQTHFETEEKHMKKYDFNRLSIQRDAHEKFTKNVESIKKRLEEEGLTDEVVDDVNEYLINWFMNHIKTEVKKFSNYVKNKRGV